MKKLIFLTLIFLSVRMSYAQTVERKNSFGISLGMSNSQVTKLPQVLSNEYVLLPNSYTYPLVGLSYQREIKDAVYGIGLNYTGDAMQIVEKSMPGSNFYVENQRLNLPVYFQVNYQPVGSPVAFLLGGSLGVSSIINQRVSSVFENVEVSPDMHSVSKFSLLGSGTATILYKASDKTLIKMSMDYTNIGFFKNTINTHVISFSFGTAMRF